MFLQKLLFWKTNQAENCGKLLAFPREAAIRTGHNGNKSFMKSNYDRLTTFFYKFFSVWSIWNENKFLIAITILKKLVESLAQMLLRKYIFNSRVLRCEFKCKFMKKLIPLCQNVIFHTNHVPCTELLLEISTSFVIFSSYFPSKKWNFNMIMKTYRRIRKHSSFTISRNFPYGEVNAICFHN